MLVSANNPCERPSDRSFVCERVFPNKTSKMNINMAGQTINDRLLAARHSLAGQGLAKSVCKATTEEMIGPKKKHLDCKSLGQTLLRSFLCPTPLIVIHLKPKQQQHTTIIPPRDREPRKHLLLRVVVTNM